MYLGALAVDDLEDLVEVRLRMGVDLLVPGHRPLAETFDDSNHLAPEIGFDVGGSLQVLFGFEPVHARHPFPRVLADFVAREINVWRREQAGDSTEHAPNEVVRLRVCRIEGTPVGIEEFRVRSGGGPSMAGHLDLGDDHDVPIGGILDDLAHVQAVLKVVGFDKAEGVMTALFFKEPGDPAWQNDPEVRAYLGFMKNYNPGVDPNDWSNVIAYYMASAVVETLKSCGAEVSRERLLGRVSHMEEVAVPVLIPGITLNTTPTDYHAIKQMRLKRFDGTRCVPLGGIISE